MMCNEVILKSIADHVEAQMYLLSDSVRLSNFTLFLQLIGIFCTLSANLWNASADVTLINWLKSKGWFDTEEEADVETNKAFEKSRLSTTWSKAITDNDIEDERLPVGIEGYPVVPSKSGLSVVDVSGKATPLDIDATDE